ncbi:hypothetical protein RB195_002704 [Necator americanus]|uniref:Uncharacterized protein n=1 Tax=Necator americanus TaxID=51031 RepID=A0ABR1DKH0_NECAM
MAICLSGSVRLDINDFEGEARLWKITGTVRGHKSRKITETWKMVTVDVCAHRLGRVYKAMDHQGADLTSMKLLQAKPQAKSHSRKSKNLDENACLTRHILLTWLQDYHLFRSMQHFLKKK